VAKIRHAQTASEALQGRDHVVLVGTQPALTGPLPRRLFRSKWARLAQRMAADTQPGAQGKTAGSWTGGDSPARVSVAVLPETVSRHLSPSRHVAIETCVGKAGWEPGESVAVVLFLDDAAHQLAAVNAIGRCLPLYDRKSGRRKPVKVTVLSVGPDGGVLAPPREVTVTTEAARWAAALVERPTAELSTADFVEETAREIKGLKTVAMSVIEGDELLEAGLGGLHAVGRAAEVGPRLMVLRYEPARGEGGGPHVALVGKGLVYDTGGLSLKVGGHMVGMKTDMGGAAAVTGAFLSLARLRHPRPLSCLVALAENAIGPTAYRPDDILVMHSGKTVEVNNTDAEGRICLGDAVSYAARELKADCIIDAATLTGAQLVATGKRHAAVMSNREGLERLAIECGRGSGDLVHPLPFAPELFQAELKSDVADMTNSVKDRMNAQASCAAQFVWSHAEDTGVPWAHVDLAGPALAGPRASGFGVALFVEWLSCLGQEHLAD
jgi:probable aminopeptidase NPEPL1